MRSVNLKPQVGSRAFKIEIQSVSNFRRCVYLVFIFATLFTSCRQKNSVPAEVEEEQEQEAETAVQENKTSSPQFSADSAYYFIEQQLAFGPRVPGTQGQQKCAAYMEHKLKEYGATVIMQKATVTVYNGKRVPCINVIGSYNPQAKRRLLLCTHWDTRPYADQDDSAASKPILAADDAGSGVGVLLEIARQLQQKAPSIGVDIIMLDVEDYGPPEYELNHPEGDFYCLGTQYWCANPHVPGYKAESGILLDMVGGRGATFTYEGVSMQYASEFMKKVWKKAEGLGYGNFFQKEMTSSIIDDHYYINSLAKIPTIDIIHRTYSTRNGFPKHWHTHDDDMDIIDKQVLKAVGETVLATVYDF